MAINVSSLGFCCTRWSKRSNFSGVVRPFRGIYSCFIDFSVVIGDFSSSCANFMICRTCSSVSFKLSEEGLLRKQQVIELKIASKQKVKQSTELWAADYFSLRWSRVNQNGATVVYKAVFEIVLTFCTFKLVYWIDKLTSIYFRSTDTHCNEPKS